MPRRRSQATPTKTGRTWSPISGLTITERGPKQLQARVRRTGRAAQTKTFDTSAEAEALRVNVVDGFIRNAFVDRRKETRATLADVLERYKDLGLKSLKSAVQARSQIDELLKTVGAALRGRDRFGGRDRLAAQPASVHRAPQEAG